MLQAHSTHRIPTRLWLVGGLVLVFGFVGCQDAATMSNAGLQIRTAALASCPDNPNVDGEFPENATSVILQLSGGALQAPLTRSFSTLEDGAAALTDIPVGEDMSLQVVACTLSNQVNWAGSRSGIDVNEIGEVVDIPIMLTPTEGVARVGTCSDVNDSAIRSSAGRAFGMAASTPDGAVMVAGGFSSLSGGRTLVATSVVDRYDPNLGRFIAAQPLDEARAMALAVPLADGSVRLVGGVTSLDIGNAQPFDVKATDAPQHAVVDYRPESGTVALTDLTLPALPAVAMSNDGAVLAVGGISQAGVPSNHALWLAPALSSGETTSKALTLPSARFGAALAFAGDDALVWGGNEEGATDTLAVWFDSEAQAFTSLELSADTEIPDTSHFATLSYLNSSGLRAHFVALGGVGLGFRDVQVARAWILSVDAVAASVQVRPLAGVDALSGRLQRAAARQVTLDDGRVWLYGGYQSFTQGAADGPCGQSALCFQGDSVVLNIDTMTASVTSSALRTFDKKGSWELGPFGAEAAKLVDGSWLITGGMVDLNSTVGTDAGLIRFSAPDAAICAAGSDTRTTP